MTTPQHREVGVGRNFRPLERDQQFLMPPSLRDWLPDDHLAWVVIDAVASVDLEPFRARYRDDGRGAAAYDPAMMVSLLLYAYATGERSSRAIERRCAEDVAYRVICANTVPDHATVARFRATHAPALGGLFEGVLRLCREAGFRRIGLVALDGTKVAADASMRHDRSADGLDAAIGAMLAEAAATDAAEDAALGPDRRGDEPPDGLADRGSRLARFTEARRQLAVQEAAKEADVAAARERQVARGGGGQAPRVDAVRRRTWDARNTTDPDARRMLGGPERHWLIGYNAQAAVSEDGLVIAAAVTQAANDVAQLAPMLAAATANAAAAGLGRIGALVADSGYWSEANGALDDPAGTRVLIVPNPGRRRVEGSRTPPRPGREGMRRRLRHPANAARLARRGTIVEPVFGELKEARRFRRFGRRGLAACDAEWRLVCIAHNLRKLHRLRLRDRPGTSGPRSPLRPRPPRTGSRSTAHPSRPAPDGRDPLRHAIELPAPRLRPTA